MTRPASRQIFVDTSAFFAIMARRDANFMPARRIVDRLQREQAQLVTTTYVVAESHALFLRRLGRDAAVDFLRSFEASRALLVRPSSTEEQVARQIIYRYTDKTFSLTDAISFAMMERMGISTAFTFDRDFTQYGFAALQP